MTERQPFYAPLIGPDAYSEEWYQARSQGIFASEAAAACGLSEYATPLDVYLEKTGQAAPFAGNDYTARGKRFEPFIASEYQSQTEVPLETGMPMFWHPAVRFIGATPDAMWRFDKKHLVEFKACGWRRASKVLGDEGTDAVPEDWLLQAQIQMFVMGAAVCDIFVMCDLHSYKLFTVDRNEPLIERAVEQISALWYRVQRRQPPAPDFGHPGALASIKALYGDDMTAPIELGRDAGEKWALRQQLKAEIKALEKRCEVIDAEMFATLGTAAAGRFAGSGRVGRSYVAPAYWTAADIAAAECARASQTQGVRQAAGKAGQRMNGKIEFSVPQLITPICMCLIIGMSIVRML